MRSSSLPRERTELVQVAGRGVGSLEALPIVEAMGEVISRVGDAIWDFGPLVLLPNRRSSDLIVKWPEQPSLLYSDAKRALYLWSKFGRPGIRKPSPVTVASRASAAVQALGHFDRLGVRSLSEINALAVADYVQAMRDSGVGATRVQAVLSIFDITWLFRDELEDPLTQDPFGAQTLGEVSGSNSLYAQGFVAKTPVIPPSVLAKLFDCAAMLVRQARNGHDVGLQDLLAAALFLLQIGTGMRNAEATGVARGGWRKENKDGVEYCWVRTLARKTAEGMVDYLAPAEVLEALDVLSTHTSMLHERREEALSKMEAAFASAVEPKLRAKLAGALAHARATRCALFIAQAPGGLSEASCLSNGQCNRLLQRLAKLAKVDWDIANHQCRRTFAWTVANGRLGRRSMIFLKWQLKHVTMSMTQLYAANPLQDDRLYGELYEEVVAARSDLMADWFSDGASLAGGAGRKIMRMRAVPVKDKASLLRHTAEQITIRATGHSWCLGQDGNCVGGGIYEATRCSDCGNGVIDSSVADVWRGIHRQNLELLSVNDCGQAVMERARREVARSAQVLRDLGVELEGP